MEAISGFYQNEKETSDFFYIGKRDKKKIFDLVNRFKLENIHANTVLAEQIDEDKFADDIRESIVHSLEKEWGFDESMKIESK